MHDSILGGKKKDSKRGDQHPEIMSNMWNREIAAQYFGHPSLSRAINKAKTYNTSKQTKKKELYGRDPPFGKVTYRMCLV